MLTREERQTIEEVLYATRMHQKTVAGFLKGGCGKAHLGDVELGMTISVSKLDELLRENNPSCKKCGSPLTKKGRCTDHTCPYHDHPQDKSLESLYESRQLTPAQVRAVLRASDRDICP